MKFCLKGGEDSWVWLGDILGLYSVRLAYAEFMEESFHNGGFSHDHVTIWVGSGRAYDPPKGYYFLLAAPFE